MTASVTLPQLAAEGLSAAYCERTCLGWSGLADVVAMRWDDELVGAAYWRVRDLPDIIEPGTIVGHLSHGMALTTGLPRGLPIVAGPGDQAASLYALGTSRPGDLVDGASTFPLLMGVADHFFVPHNGTLEVMPGVVPGTWHPLGGLLGSGAMPAWFAQEIAGSSIDEVEREAAAVGTSAGVLALPYGIAGAGRDARGAVWGWDASVHRGHLYYALLEGIAFEYALLAEALVQEGVTVNPPVLSYGGGSASPLFATIKAQVLGLPLCCVGAVEVAPGGAALCAARAGGWSVALEVPQGRTVEPDPTEVAAYRPRLQTYRRWRETVLGFSV